MPAYEHPDLVALDEVEDLLEAYAEARLSPSGPVLARMRRRVLSDAAALSATRAAAARATRHQGAPRPRFPWLPPIRVPALGVASLTAAFMGLALGTAVLAAPAGSPFYGARVALEQAFLPTQIDARLASHEEHLLARLTEAQEAAVHGDVTALAAALAAYQAEVDAAIQELGDNTDLLAKLEDVLNKHVGVLEALEAKVPEQAAVDKALESSQKAIDRIKAKAAHPKPTAPGGQPGDAPGGRP